MSKEGARRLHPATIFIRFLKEGPSTVLAIPAGLAVVRGSGLSGALIAAAAMTALLAVLQWLRWRRFRYTLGDREIVIEQGLFNRSRRVIPFDRVQDVDVERALLARLFGLAKVRIETGAGGKDEGVLDSIALAEADRLRGALQAWRTGSPATADAPAEPERQILFRMAPGRVLLAGLFNFSLVYIAGVFAALQAVDQFLPFDIYDPARWIGLVGPYFPGRFSIAAIAAVSLLAVVLGVVAGLVRTFSKEFGFTLGLEDGRLRRERGLLTRSEVVIAARRVQLAQVATGPIRRALGWFGLSFQTLGAGTESSGHQSAAPFARRGEVEAILGETVALRLPERSELEMVSRRHIVRAMAGWVLPPLAAIAAASVWRPETLWLLGLLPLLALRGAVARRFNRYGIAGPLLFVSAGLWRQRLWVIPLANVHALSLRRSWLQRRLGLATLAVDTAGAPSLDAPRIVDLRLETASALAAAIGAHSSGRKSATER